MFQLRSLLLACAAAVVLASSLACQGEEARLEEHLARAEQYMEEERPSEAVIEYRNALQLNPNHPGAHWGLAKAYLEAGEPSKAFWELQEAVRLDPDNVEARLALGGFLLLGQEEEFERALEQADAVLAMEPENAEAWLLKARALERLRRFDDARAAYEKVVELEPENADWVRALAAFHMRRGDREAAEPLLRRVAELDPGFRSLAALASFVAQDPERAEEAESLYQQALEQADADERKLGYQLLASFYYQRGRYGEAERVLREGLERTGNDPDLIYALARFYHARGDVERADAMIEEATRAQPDDVRPWLVLSAYRGRNGDLEGALEAAEAALERKPDDLGARLRKAELLIDLGLRERSPERMAQGRAIVDSILAREPGQPQAQFVKAKLDLAEGRTADAIASLRRVLDARDDWPEAHLLLASALSIEGDRQAARVAAQRALELDPQLLPARRLLARVNAALGENDLAVEDARAVLAADPDDMETRILLAQSLARMGRTEEALAELRAIPEERRNADAYFALGRLYRLMGRPEEARAALERAADLQPDHPEILEALLEVDGRLGRLPEALARIEKAAGERPDDARLVRLHGLALLLSGRRAEGERQLRRAVELAPEDLANHQALASYLLAAGRLQDSVAAYEKALEARPDSASLHLTLGSLYELSGDRAKAIEHYQRAIELDAGLAVAKNNLAYLLAEEERDLDRALDLAQEAKAALPESANVADTLGWVLLKRGIPEAAIGYLKEAEAGFPPGSDQLGTVRVHLARAYQANGQPEEARRVLEQALADLAERQRKLAEAGQPDTREPGWATEARELLAALGGGAPPAAPSG